MVYAFYTPELRLWQHLVAQCAPILSRRLADKWGLQVDHVDDITQQCEIFWLTNGDNYRAGWEQEAAKCARKGTERPDPGKWLRVCLSRDLNRWLLSHLVEFSNIGREKRQRLISAMARGKYTDEGFTYELSRIDRRGPEEGPDVGEGSSVEGGSRGESLRQRDHQGHQRREETCAGSVAMPDYSSKPRGLDPFQAYAQAQKPEATSDRVTPAVSEDTVPAADADLPAGPTPPVVHWGHFSFASQRRPYLLSPPPASHRAWLPPGAIWEPFVGVAQLAERRSPKPLGAGSNPAAGAMARAGPLARHAPT